MIKNSSFSDKNYIRFFFAGGGVKFFDAKLDQILDVLLREKSKSFDMKKYYCEETGNNNTIFMISGVKKLQKAVRACTIRFLSLGTRKKHEDAAIFKENQRIRMFLELRKLHSNGAIRGYQLGSKILF